MPVKTAAILLLTVAAAAQDADPISDRLRFEIALAQRDYLIAQKQLDLAAQQLKAKVDQANKACSGKDKQFDAVAFACMERK